MQENWNLFKMEWKYGESPSWLNTAMADFKITFTITIKYYVIF